MRPIENGFVRANHHERLVAMDSVAGVSIVDAGGDPMLSITTTDDRVVDLVFEAHDTALELRAALDLEMAPAAARRFSGHREIGPLAAFIVITVSLGMLVTTFAGRSVDNHAIDALGITFSLVVVPVLIASLRRVRLTCGAEGVLVESVFRERLHPWRSIEATSSGRGSVVLAEWPRLAFELPSTDDCDLFLAFARERGATNVATTSDDPQVEAMLSRGERDVATWLGDVHAFARTRDSYRQAHIDESRLWTALSNPRAEPSARIAAAVALRARVGRGGLGRVRAIAHATSFPQLRSALNAAANATIEDDAVAHHVARAMAG